MFKKRQHETPKEYLPLQNDPLLGRLDKKYSARTLYPFVIGVAAFIVIIGLITTLTEHPNHNNINVPMLWIANGCIYTFSYYQQTFALRYWQKKLRQRPYALMHQQQLLAERQPHAIPAHAEGINLVFKARKSKTLLINFPFIILLSAYLFLGARLFIQPLFPLNTTTFMITTAIIILLCFCLLVSGLAQRRPSRIIVASNGITTITNEQSKKYEEQDAISWQDARLFSTYIGPQAFYDRVPVRYFELAGNNTIVRWQWHDKTFDRFTFTPALNKQEYDAWMQQILNQVVTYTGLPLVDLDKLGKNDMPLHRG